MSWVLRTRGAYVCYFMMMSFGLSHQIISVSGLNTVCLISGTLHQDYYHQDISLFRFVPSLIFSFHSISSSPFHFFHFNPTQIHFISSIPFQHFHPPQFHLFYSIPFYPLLVTCSNPCHSTFSHSNLLQSISFQAWNGVFLVGLTLAVHAGRYRWFGNINILNITIYIYM